MAETALLQALCGVIAAEPAIRLAYLYGSMLEARLPDLIAFADAVEDWLNREPGPSDQG